MKKLYAIFSLFAEELINLEKTVEDTLLKRETYSAFVEEDEDNEEKNYQVINGIALYSIKGKMLSSGNWVTRMFGIPTYDAVANDLAQLVQDESVDKILVSMDTPGGHYAGLSDLSETWRKVNAVKPIHVHTGGNLASGGIWLASNSEKIYASETAEVGSIGVIMQHVSQEEALKKAGIKVTSIKSSTLKGVGSPAHDLTAEDLEYLQNKVDEASQVFKTQMYRTRPAVTEEAFSGGTFSANDSFRLGLIDGISSYSSVFEQLSASADSNSNSNQSYKEEYSMKRKVTASMAEAAIAAGADPETLEVVTQEEYDALKAVNKPVEKVDVEAVVEGEVEELTAEGQEPELSAEMETLKDELATALGQVDTLTAEVADLKTKLEAANSDPLRKIAEERIGVMRIALGMTNIDMSKFSTQSMLAEYEALDEQFKKAYKPGGVIKPKVENAEGSPETKRKVYSIDQARYDAVGL